MKQVCVDKQCVSVLVYSAIDDYQLNLYLMSESPTLLRLRIKESPAKDGLENYFVLLER